MRETKKTLPGERLRWMYEIMGFAPPKNRKTGFEESSFSLIFQGFFEKCCKKTRTNWRVLNGFEARARIQKGGFTAKSRRGRYSAAFFTQGTYEERDYEYAKTSGVCQFNLL